MKIILGYISKFNIRFLTVPYLIANVGDLIFFKIVLLFVFVSCDNGDMWREKVYVSDNAYIYLYHTEKCSKNRPFFSTTENMIDYQKMKCDAFDYCFSKEQLKILSEISRNNIAEYKNKAFDYSEDKNDLNYISCKTLLLDTGECNYSTQYVIQNEKLVQLKRKWIP